MQSHLTRWASPECAAVVNREPDATDKEAQPADPSSAPSDTDSCKISVIVEDKDALSKAWTRRHVVFAYILIWCILFVDAMQQGMSSALTPYVASAFGSHSRTAATTILSGLISGLLKVPLARILVVWGRPQGFAVMVICLEIGLVMMTACNNVETYATGQVFYWVGYSGINYLMGIFIADNSALTHQGLMFAFASSPHLITVWIGGPLAKAFYDGPGFRWGFGTFAIVTPLVCSPLFALFYINDRNVRNMGPIPDGQTDGQTNCETDDRTWLQSLKHYAIELDMAGFLLIAASLALLLLPSTLFADRADTWRFPVLAAFFIAGGMFMDRTVLGACVLTGVMSISLCICDSYFLSFLQVVNGLDMTTSSYISSTYNLTSCVWSLVVGLLIRTTGRFKWLALYFGVPLTILGVGLMAHFRQPDGGIGYIVMCQVFIAVARGTLVICEQTALSVTATGQCMAVVIAVESMITNVGGAMGSAVAEAIWNAVFPGHLARRLPPDAQDKLPSIVGSLGAQLSYPVGSPTRTAIQRAYGDAERIMMVASTVVQVISLASVLMWRDVKVKEFKQVTGLVI